MTEINWRQVELERSREHAKERDKLLKIILTLHRLKAALELAARNAILSLEYVNDTHPETTGCAVRVEHIKALEAAMALPEQDKCILRGDTDPLKVSLAFVL